MSDNERLLELIDTAYDSAGRSSEQFSKYQDTLEYRIKQISNSWEQLRTNFLDSEVYRNALDVISDFLSKVNDMSTIDFVAIGATFLILGKTVITSIMQGIQGSTSGLLNFVGKKIDVVKNYANKKLSEKTGSTSVLSKLLGLGSDDLSSIDSQISALKIRIQNFRSQMNSLPSMDLIDEQEAIKDLERIRAEIMKLEASERNMATQYLSENYKAGPSESANLFVRKQLAGDLLGNKESQASAMKQRGHFLGSVLATAFTTAVAVVITEDDPMKAFGKIMLSSIATIGPMVISQVFALGTEITAAAVASTAGAAIIILAITAALAAATVGIKYLVENAGVDELQKKIDEQEKRVEELQKKIDETKNSLSESKESEKSAKKLRVEFTKLNEKQVLTTEEQEKYNSLVEEIRSDYPEIVTYYNEVTGELRTQNDLWDNILEKMELATKGDASQLYLQQAKYAAESLASVDLDVDKQKRELDKLDVFNKEFMSRDDTSHKTVENDTFQKRLQEGVGRVNIGNREHSSQSLLRSYQQDGSGEAFIDIDRLAPFFGPYDTSNMSEGDWDNLLSQMSDADDEGWKMVESYISDTTKNIDEAADRQKGFIEDQRKAALVSNIQAQTGENVAVSTYIAEEFEKSDKNVEFKSLKGSGWGNNLAEWDDLTEDQRKILATTEDFSNEYDYNENRRHGAKIKRLEEAYEEAAKIYIEKMAIEFATELSPSQKEAISDFTANANEYSLEQLEGEEGKHYINILGDSETAKQQVQEYKDAINEALTGGEGVEKGGLSAYIVDELNPEDAINEVVDKFKNAPSLDEFTEYYKSWGLKNIQAFISAIENVPESQRDEYGKALHNFFASENLTEEQAGVLFSVNLENLDVLGLEEAKETYIDSLIEMGSSTGEAEEIWKGFIDTVATYGSNLSISSVVGVEEFITKISEVRATAMETWGAIKTAQEEFFEKGNLSIENMNALIEAGYEDFIKITSSGIQLDTSGMMSFYFDSISNGTELLNQQILFNEQKEVERKLRIAKLKLDIEALKFAGVLTQAQQESLYALEEELSLEESLAISSRMATQELRNQRGLMELTDVQSVVDAMSDFDDKVQETSDNVGKLKKSSDDATKSVKDLEKALNDAEQALEEAKHGTQDFRSGLDGLINYTAKLNDLNRSIENIKTSLEDVSNVSEAGDLLEQLSSSYTDKEVTLGAESLVVDDALANLQSTLEQNFGQFISFQDGQAIINFSYQQMDDNDELKKAFEEEFDLWNEYKNESNDIQDEIQAIQKERIVYQEESLKNYVSLQEDLISTLKSLSQEEVDTIKAKYDAIEEADNKYLDALSDAIEKQRKLRDLETSYTDLAAKEKQLALMQRDTSGANQSEIQSLTDEIDTDRQKLLDTEVDNLVDSLKELYEQQKEARDAEIEYMETVTESADHFAQWAQEIMATWTSAEDMSAWYLQNNPDVQDMTVEQTESYLNELSKNYSAYAQYNALQATNFTTEQESLNTAIQAMYNNTSENISNIGTITQSTAQEAAEKIKLEAQEALDDANEKLTKGKEDAQIAYNEWKTAEDALAKSRLDSINATADGIQKLIDLSNTLSTTAAAYAISSAANFDNVDLSDTTSAKNMATKQGLGSDTEGYKNSFIQAVYNAGGDISQYPNSTGIIKDQQGSNIVYGGHAVIWGNGSTTWYNSKEEADAALANAQRSVNSPSDAAFVKGAKAYKNGGLVDYTGPAWVDGTPSDPESFLSSEDTARIGAAAKLLSDLPLLNKNNVDKDIVASNVGDISVEIHLNVAELSNDYDTEQMVDKVKKEIAKSLASTGSSVILDK